VSQALSQLLNALQSNDSGSTQSGQDASLSPGAIILQTLSNAGIDVSGNS
jgi:hypothetical protein